MLRHLIKMVVQMGPEASGPTLAGEPSDTLA